MREAWPIWACGILVTVSAWADPYCLLRKPVFGGSPSCFEFYLADTARSSPLATPAGAACVLTPLAVRQGWSPDPTFPGPLPDWRTGDLAMGEVSPYHKDRYGCHARQGGGGTGSGTGGGPGGGVGGTSCGVPAGCQVQQVTNQPESRDASGRITVEAATIKVFSCPTGLTYLYQYVNRNAFRVVKPPNWSSPVGGRDFGTCEQAMAAAANAGLFGGDLRSAAEELPVVGKHTLSTYWTASAWSSPLRKPCGPAARANGPAVVPARVLGPQRCLELWADPIPPWPPLKPT